MAMATARDRGGFGIPALASWPRRPQLTLPAARRYGDGDDLAVRQVGECRGVG
jgi:hypothetical protein